MLSGSRSVCTQVLHRLSRPRRLPSTCCRGLRGHFIPHAPTLPWSQTGRVAVQQRVWLHTSSSFWDENKKDDDDNKEDQRKDEEASDSQDVEDQNAEEARSPTEAPSTLPTSTTLEEYKSSDGALPVAQIVPDFWPRLPVLAVTKHPVFPKFVKVVEVTEPQLMALLRRKVRLNQPYAGLFVKREDENNDEVVDTVDKLYHVGTFVQILEMHDLGNLIRMVVLGHRRINLVEAVHEEDRLQDTMDDNNKAGHNSKMTDTSKEESGGQSSPLSPSVLMVETTNFEESSKYEMSDEMRALTQEVVKTIRDIIALNPLYRDSLQQMMAQGQRVVDNPVYLSDLGAALSSGDTKEIVEILSEPNIDQRLRLALGLLKKEYEVSKLQQKIGKEVEEKVKAVQRKYLLQEQLKVIRKELGLEKDDTESIAEQFTKRLENLVIPPSVSTVIEDELKRLRYLDSHSSEFNVCRTYLEWLTTIPWGVQSEEHRDISRAREALERHHYGLSDVKKRILEFIAVSILRESTQGKILCFVGPPGVGKTSIARSVADALGRSFFRFSVGGLSDVAELKGHRRTYVGAMPGKAIQALQKTKSENPVILIDEIDKMGRGSFHGDPSSALLEMLDPEQNATFLDNYLDVPVDLSKVLFICTANTMETVLDPLKDRMEVIQVSGYVAEEKLHIAKHYLLPQIFEQTGLASRDDVGIADEALTALIKSYCRESGVRNLKKHIERMARKMAFVLVTEEQKETLNIDDKNLKEYVGKPVFSNEKMFDQTPIGVCTGLAWTTHGGSVLYIETAALNSSQEDEKSKSLDPVIQSTGNMGDVMKESVRIAFTFSRLFLRQHLSDEHALNNKSIHLHIPEGATPKDGPSAGCTIVTALLSLALNRPVKENVAMTGEISLCGKILPVGGIKEKVIAAKRSGITELILPMDNRNDFDELPDVVKENVIPHFVQNYKEIFDIVLH